MRDWRPVFLFSDSPLAVGTIAILASTDCAAAHHSTNGAIRDERRRVGAMAGVAFGREPTVRLATLAAGLDQGAGTAGVDGNDAVRRAAREGVSAAVSLRDFGGQC